ESRVTDEPVAGVIGRAQGTRAYLAAVLLAFAGIAFWSTNALAGSTALATLDLGVVLVLQFTSATAALCLIAGVSALRRRRLHGTEAAALRGRDYAYGALVGFVGFCGTQTTQYVGFAYAPIVESNIIAYAWPMFAAVWMAITARSRHTVAGFLLSLVGFAGVGITTVAQHTGTSTGSTVGYISALASALCMAYYTLAVARTRTSPIYVMLTGGACGIVVSAIMALALHTRWDPSVAWLAMAYVGVGPCAAGFLLWSAGMAKSRGRLAPLGYATPVMSTCVLLIVGRSFGNPIAAVGAILVLLCTIGVLVNDRLSGAQQL